MKSKDKPVLSDNDRFIRNVKLIFLMSIVTTLALMVAYHFYYVSDIGATARAQHQVAGSSEFKSSVEPLPSCAVNEAEMIQDPVVAAYIEKHVTSKLAASIDEATAKTTKKLTADYREKLAELERRSGELNSKNGQLALSLSRTERTLLEKLKVIEANEARIASLQSELVQVANVASEQSLVMSNKLEEMEETIAAYEVQEAKESAEAAERELMYAREAKAIEDKMAAIKLAAQKKREADKAALEAEVLAKAKAQEAEKLAKAAADKEAAEKAAEQEAVKLAEAEKAKQAAKEKLAKADAKPTEKTETIAAVKVETVKPAPVKKAAPVKNNNQEIAGLRLKAEKYAKGIGVNTSLKKAVEYFEKAAQLGDVQSMHALGSIYERGDSTIDKDEGLSRSWYRRAADKGYALSQHNLGAMYDRMGNKSEAFLYYHKAAQQDLVIDQFNVGAFYLMGEGVAVDEEEGLAWMKKAAANGHDEAKAILMEYAKN